MANSQPLSYNGPRTFSEDMEENPITFADYSRLYPSTMHVFSISPEDITVPENLNDQERMITNLALELKNQRSVTIPGVKNPVKNFIKHR